MLTTQRSILYEKGNGVKQDFSLAVKLFEKAAELGNADAMAHLAMLYEEGKLSYTHKTVERKTP